MTPCASQYLVNCFLLFFLVSDSPINFYLLCLGDASIKSMDVYPAKNETPVSLRTLVKQRNCDGCTKCCEGYFSDIVYGIPFHEGKPCHFVDIGKGCTIYEDRPKSPCQDFRCGWIADENIPLWMKPNLVDAVVAYSNLNGFDYCVLKEAGATLDSRVLSWMIVYCSINKFNLAWQVSNGWNAIGSSGFVEAFYTSNNKPIDMAT